MDERLRFLARVLDGEPMTEVCRDFRISRKTGYKIFDRYKEHGLEALSDRSRCIQPMKATAPEERRPSIRRTQVAPAHFMPGVAAQRIEQLGGRCVPFQLHAHQRGLADEPVDGDVHGRAGECRDAPGPLAGAGAGKTGKILISTVTAVANASYAITLWLRKTTL